MVHLANLRGGLDNITVVLARIGPWVDPDSAADAPALGDGKHADSGKKNGWIKGLSGLIGKKKGGDAPPEEEHRYRSCDCPISEEMIDPLAELVRKVQATAIEQTWPADWPKLAAHRRHADIEREAGRLRRALKHLGESIDMLGQAGRLHRKMNT